VSLHVSLRFIGFPSMGLFRREPNSTLAKPMRLKNSVSWKARIDVLRAFNPIADPMNVAGMPGIRAQIIQAGT
jgi:hypothetical protein